MFQIKKNLVVSSAMVLVTIGMMACTPVPRVQGNLVSDTKLEQVKIGESSQRDVLEILGTPTTISSFDESIWLYIGEKTEQTAFYRPDVVNRRIIKLDFNDEGYLETIEEVDESKAQEISVSRRETPSSGRNFTIMQQFMGNLGKFNKDSFEK